MMRLKWKDYPFIPALWEGPVLRSIMPVVTRQPLKDFDEKMQDLEYWLRRPAKERLSAVTFIISQTLEKGQRMDRTFVSVKKLKS